MKHDRPAPGGNYPMDWASDVMAEMLRRLGVKYVALNPGASYRGLHDSMVNYLGNEDPEMILCLHEDNAISIPHGYAKVTGKPMGAIVHSNVGLMHASMGIFNAWCDRVPIIVLGATGSVDAHYRRPWIEWIHTAQDQGALVREFTKWDDQPASAEAVVEAMLRANILAQTPPCGPVYINLDTHLQEEELGREIEIPDDLDRYRPTPQPTPSEGSLADVAKVLAKAKRPMILMGRVSRDEGDWDRRVELAELLRARVMTDVKQGAAFPTEHELHTNGPTFHPSSDEAELVAQADVVLSLDWADLAGMLLHVEQAGGTKAEIVHVSVDQYVHGGWSKDHQALPPVDHRVLAMPDPVVGQLVKMLKGEKIAGGDQAWIDANKDKRPDLSNVSVAEFTRAERPITLGDLGLCFNEAVEGRDICLVRVPLGYPPEVCKFAHPLDYLGYDGGAGVGSGPGQTIGAALALQDTGRLAVSIIGDGEYIMCASAIWTAAHYELPLLMIVANNRFYYNDVTHQEKIAIRRDRPVENKWLGQAIDDPPPDIAMSARSYGAEGIGPVERLADLPGAIRDGLAIADAGKPCVLDVVVSPEYQSPMLAESGRSTTLTR